MAEQHDILDKLSEEVKASITQRTVEIWTLLYTYIEKNGSADMYDPALGQLGIAEDLGLTSGTISNHLRRMARLGLISAWKMVRPRKKKGEFSNLFRMFYEGIPPSHIVRYTLIGKEPPLELDPSESRIRKFKEEEKAKKEKASQ